MSSAIGRVLDALKSRGCDPKATAQGWTCRCPAHPDDNPSLSIALGDDGRVLVHCHARCTPEDVVSAVGLQLSDLFDRLSASTRCPPPKYLVPPTLPKQRGVASANTAVEAATALHRRGFRVIPVPIRQKSPGLTGWGKLRIELDQIPQRFTGERNVGVLLGEPSGWLVDVDLDDPVAVLLADELLPRTSCVFGRESKPRSHRIYRVTGSIESLQLKRKPTPQEVQERRDKGETDPRKLESEVMVVEIRSTGLHTIAPGSVHPSGEPVEWYDDRDAALVSPDELIRAVESLADQVRKEYGETAGEPGPQTWQPPRDLPHGPTPPPFPIDAAFPPGLKDIKDFLAAVAEGLQVPLDLPVMLLLPIAGLAIAKKFEIEVRAGWREVPALWSLCLAESGERKSGTMSAMIKPVLEWEHEEALRLGPEVARRQEERRIDETRLASLRKNAAKGNAEARAEAQELAERFAAEKLPTFPMVFTSDATTEALAGMLVENHERALVASAEADALDVMMGRYSERSTPNMGIWLKGHSGDPERIVRRSRPPETLKRPVLNVAMAVQPEAIRGLYASRMARGRGLLARFLPSAPVSLVGSRKTGGEAVPVAEVLRQRYDSAIKRLLQLPIDPEGPIIVSLSAEASALFCTFEARIERQLGRSGCLCERRDWGGKLCGAVARIALVLHELQQAVWSVLQDAADAHVIQADTMRAALAWVPYLIEHEQIVASAAGCDRDTVVADVLLRWLEQSGFDKFTKRQAYQARRSALVEHPDDLNGPLGLLEELGYIRPVPPPQPRAVGGRPPSPSYVVNPLWKRGGGQ